MSVWCLRLKVWWLRMFKNRGVIPCHPERIVSYIEGVTGEEIDMLAKDVNWSDLSKVVSWKFKLELNKDMFEFWIDKPVPYPRKSDIPEWFQHIEQLYLDCY